jgi:hypothetical protein
VATGNSCAPSLRQRRLLLQQRAHVTATETPTNEQFPVPGFCTTASGLDLPSVGIEVEKGGLGIVCPVTRSIWEERVGGSTTMRRRMCRNTLALLRQQQSIAPVECSLRARGTRVVIFTPRRTRPCVRSQLMFFSLSSPPTDISIPPRAPPRHVYPATTPTQAIPYAFFNDDSTMSFHFRPSSHISSKIAAVCGMPGIM